jgi:hypothetical protein
MPCYIIRRVRIAHCKRGPSRCEKCREMDAERICLLDICPEGEMQRRVIQVNEAWCEFDIVRMFESEEDASQYAHEHGIEDVHF